MADAGDTKEILQALASGQYDCCCTVAAEEGYVRALEFGTCPRVSFCGFF